MYEAEDKLFFDELYQQWSKTTWAEKSHWMPVEDTNYEDGGPGTWNIVAVEQKDDQWRLDIASYLTEADADFICGLHGAIPDLIRRLHEAIDEAERKDEANDIAQGQLAEALLENIELTEQLDAANTRLQELGESL